MAKLSPDLQVTVPRALVERLGLQAGDEVEWISSGESLQVLPMVRRPSRSLEDRLVLFDQATDRQRAREACRPAESSPPNRGWKREELYDRARPR